MQNAVSLARHLVIAGALSFVVAAAAGDVAPGALQAPESKATIHVKMMAGGGSPLASEGFVVFKSTSGAPPLVLPTKLPANAVTELPAGSQWTLIADFPGYYAATSVFQVPRDARSEPVEVEVTLWPAGTLTGKFVVSENEKLPTDLEARFEPARDALPRKQEPPAGVAACAVSAEGDWRCRVPAGSFDIALYPKGFVPHYLWNTRVTAGETCILGARKLIRGASVTGWVAREDGTPADKCRVRLEPATAPGRSNDPALDFLRSVASEVPCQKKGFFQFSAVAAGSYALVAQEGDALAQMAPVEVWEGSESRITIPILLRKPVDFEVTISPPVDWLGRPWRFEARRATDYRSGWEDPSFRAEASPDGSVRIPRRLPGRFWLTVYDQLGNALFSDTQVDLSDAAQAYPITIDLLWVEGSVQLGDQPVAGRLVFSGPSGASSIVMTTDEEGRFEGPLPKPGNWRVDVEASEPRLRASVKVEVKPKGNRAAVAIELPDTKVYGKVVDPEGAPAAGAVVALSSVISTLEATTDQKGEFELRAFPEGTLEVSAARSSGRGRREVSDTYMFEASEESPHGPVVLALRRDQPLRGRVLSATGAVIGATVDAWPAAAGDGFISSVRSRIDGSFEIQVPEGTRAVKAVVSPPAGSLKAYEVHVAKEAEILLQVESQGGELVVDVGKEDSFEGRILAVWQGDIGLPLGTLIRWAEGHGARFYDRGQVRVPRLAPGYYTVCLGTPAVIDPDDIEEWQKSRAACASGFLAEASTLNLRLP